MRFSKLVIAAISMAVLASCSKNNGDTIAETAPAPEVKGTIPVPVGFKVLTESDMRQSLAQQGLQPIEIMDYMAHMKLTIRPEQFGQTAAQINAKLQASPTQASTENLPNLFEAAIVQNDMVDVRSSMDPNTINPFTGTSWDDQRYRYSGNHWYHNQAPGGCTWGYWQQSGTIRYKKWANSHANITNCDYNSRVSYCPRSNNTQGTQGVYLYYWNGAAWIAIWSQTIVTNSPSFISPDINGLWRLGGEYFLLGTGVQTNGWNPPGWQVWRTQHVQFRLYW